jgi:hypothetical protein
MTIHSIARYSAGFGGSNASHKKNLALLGKMVGTQCGPALGENKVTKTRANFYSIPISVHEGFL